MVRAGRQGEEQLPQPEVGFGHYYIQNERVEHSKLSGGVIGVPR